MRYATNPQVIHETIDGETIVIDLATGTYFSMRGSGPRIWEILSGGATAADVVDDLVRTTDADAARIESAVEPFLADLAREGLIAPPSGASPPLPATPSEPTGEHVPFEPPLLEKYDDMQDILLLDPVHEVKSAGWPHTAAEAQSA